MISLLVSSKTMQPSNCPYDVPTSIPLYLKEAEILDEYLKQLSPLQLKRLMHLSPALADTTKQRVMSWGGLKKTPAWYTFVGDVYKGLKINTFTKEDLDFAQEHLATLSGLYGILRPLDIIHPYRLELGYKLKGRGFNNLYDFWTDKIALTIPLGESVINLASEEYMKVLRPYLPKSQIITPWFMQLKNGKPDFQAIHAKIARGTMGRWICNHKVNDPSQLKNFNYSGYSFQADLSGPSKPVFTRPEHYDFRADY